MGKRLRVGLMVGIAAAAGTIPMGVTTAQPAQKVTGPIANYWMSATTQTGFGMGGGAPSMGSMMGMMMGGGGGANKSLDLLLGSSQAPTGAPAAEHLPPQALRAGNSLPLITPNKPPPAEKPPELPREFVKPKGKIMIFWGCGPRAKPGQPVTFDFAQLAAGKPPPPAFTAAMRGFNLSDVRSPIPSKTHGYWPNEKTRTRVAGASSLVGEHTVRGNYSPEIKFTLAQNQDFMGPLNLTTNAKASGGWVDLGWNSPAGAQAYLATALGGGQDQVVIWTSSEIQAALFAMPDYLTPGDIARLIANRALMSPQTTRCQVPKEVIDAMPEGAAIVQLQAYGGETNMVYPPRPTDPKVPWDRQWALKVRYRSMTGGMLGMAMPGMGGGMEGMGGQAQQGGRQPPQQQQAPDPRRAIMKGIGGAIGIPGF